MEPVLRVRDEAAVVPAIEALSLGIAGIVTNERRNVACISF